jgi:hypothetical protein
VTKHSVDECENRRRERRREDELRLSWLERRRILRRNGASEDDISEALERAHKVRKQREKTMSTWRSKLDKVEEVQQSIFRSLGRTFHPKEALKTKY